MKNIFKLTKITKGLICAVLFILTIMPNNVFASTNTKKVSAINGRVTVTFKYALTKTPKVTDFAITQVTNKGKAKKVKATKITLNSTKKIVILTVPVVAETSKTQYVVYKVSYKKDIVVSSPAITVAKVTAVIANPVANLTVSSVSAINATSNIGDTYTLPTTVTATLSDGTTKDLAVIWDKVADTTVVGTYTFTGVLTMVDGVVNTNNVTVNATLGVNNPIESVIVTVRTADFGAMANATSTQEGATQYQIFDGTTALSAIANLGTDTTIFPAKVVGDTVIIKLFNAVGIVVGTANVTLVAPNN